MSNNVDDNILCFVIKFFRVNVFFVPEESLQKNLQIKKCIVHLKYECGIKPQFKCTLCMKLFKQPGSFKFHMLFKHKKIV